MRPGMMRAGDLVSISHTLVCAFRPARPALVLRADVDARGVICSLLYSNGDKRLHRVSDLSYAVKAAVKGLEQ